MRSFINFATVCWLLLLLSDTAAFQYRKISLNPPPRHTRLLSDQQGRFSPRPPSFDPEERQRRKPSPPEDPPDKLFFIKESETFELKWEDFTESSLREELSSRDLPKDGTKDDLVARLEEDDSRTAAKQFGEWLKTLVTADFEKGVPSKTIQGAALAAALLGAIAGKGIITTGVASVGAAYAAILPGAAGNVIRLLGSLSFDAAKATSDLVSKLDKSVLPTTISAITEQQKLRREKRMEAEAKEQELRRRQKVELVLRLLMEARFRYEALDKQKVAAKLARQRAELASRSLMEARFRYQALDKQRFALIEAARLVEAKRVEIARLKEEAKIAEAKRLEEEELLLQRARLAEEERIEQEFIAEEARLAEEARVEQEKIEAEARKAEEARIEQERLAEEARIEQERIAEETRLAEVARVKQERIEAEARLEQERIAEESRLAEEARIEQERMAEETHIEQERIDAEARQAEEARTEQERLDAEARRAEEVRLEQERIAEEARVAEIARAKQKLSEDALLAEKEAREAALLEKEEETLPDDDFSDEDWQASIRAAQQSLEAKIANLAEAMADEDEKAEWDAAEKLATSLSDVMDDDGDELDIEALAAAARAAVDSYEELQDEKAKEKHNTRKQWESEMETNVQVEESPKYLELTVAKLREECSIRGLPVGGKKADLAIRLEEDDDRQKGGIVSDEMKDSGNNEGEAYVAGKTDWARLTVVQLKEELSSRGLATTGKKIELIARLESSASQQSKDSASDKELRGETIELDDLEDIAAAARAAVEMYSNDLFEEEAVDTDNFDETELAEAARAAVDMFDLASDQSYSDLDDDFDEEALAEAARAAVEMFESDVFTEADSSANELMVDEAEDGEVADWYGMTLAQLRNELSLRGLPNKGKRNDLLSALEASQFSVPGELEDEDDDEFDGEQLARTARELTLRFDPDEEPSDAALMEIEVNEKGAFWEIEESVPESPVVDFSAMTVAELKEELRKRGLSVSGKKSDLISRLTQR